MIYQAVATPIQHDTAGRALKALWLGLLAALFVAVQAIQAYARPDSFADLADKVSPAVVNITTSTVVAQGAGPGPIVPEGSPFEDFFKEFQDRNRDKGDRPRRSSALGSGPKSIAAASSGSGARPS